MNTPINKIYAPTPQQIHEEMAAKYRRLQDRIKKRRKIGLYGVIGFSIIFSLFVVIVPILIQLSSPLGASPFYTNIAIYSSYFLFFVLFIFWARVVNKKIPLISAIDTLFYYCYEICDNLKGYLKDKDPFSLVDSAQVLKKINSNLPEVKVDVKNVPILRHNPEYKIFLRLRELFQKKVRGRLRTETEIEDIEILKCVFDRLSHFFHNDKEESSSLSFAIKYLEGLEDIPYRIFGFDVIGLIKRVLYSDNDFVRMVVTFPVALTFMLLIAWGFFRIISFLFGTPMSELILPIFTLSFGGAITLTAAFVIRK